MAKNPSKTARKRPAAKPVKRTPIPKPRAATAEDLGIVTPTKPREGQKPPGRERPISTLKELLEKMTEDERIPAAQRPAFLRVTEVLVRDYLPKYVAVVPKKPSDVQRAKVNEMIQGARDSGKDLFIWDYYEAMVEVGRLR